MQTRQVFIDTETSGLGPSSHRIIEIAAVEAINGQLTGKVFHTYLNPERSINPYAQKVHGLSLRLLQNQPKFNQIATQFISFVSGSECLMHNASFDCGFINAELVRAGYNTQLTDFTQITCTLKLARLRFPGEKMTLDNLITRAGLNVMRGKHSALEDASLLAKAYFAVLRSSSV